MGNDQAQAKTFEVVCTGLLVQTGSCLKKAQELCGILPGSPSVPSPAQVLLHGDALSDFDRADLKPARKRELDSVIGEGKRFRVVQVSGYTDSVGSDDYDNALSARRAREVSPRTVFRGDPA